MVLTLRSQARTSDGNPPPTRRIDHFPAPLGSLLGLGNGLFEWIGSLGIFSWQVLKAAVTPPFEWRELIRQLDEVGSKSLPVLLDFRLTDRHYSQEFRLPGMTDANLKLTQDFAFFRDLHKFHLFRVVQPNRPGMLQASHGGDD